MKNKKEKQKIQRKGELTTQQIVGLIILITSFVVILFLLFRLNLGEETNKELCRNSVLLRGKSIFPESAPLNCKRTYRCITEDGSCEGLSGPEIIKVKTANETYKEIADEISDCWWMFGEGKVNYAGEDLLEKNYCSICFQMVFDDSLSKIEEFKDGKIDKRNLQEYLSKTKIPSKKITYMEYLYGANLNLTPSANFGSITLGKQYFTLIGIKSKTSQALWTAGGGAAGALGTGLLLTFFTAPVSIPLLTATVLVVGTAGGAEAGSYIGTIVEGESGNEFLTTVIKADSDEFMALNCDEILTKG